MKKSAAQSSEPCESDESRNALDRCAPTGHLYLARNRTSLLCSDTTPERPQGRTAELILADKPHPEQRYRSCMALFRDAKRYPNERVDAACVRALAIGAPNRRSVQSILIRGLDQQPLEESDPIRRVPHENMRPQK